MKPHVISSGKGEIILNKVGDRCGVMVCIDGACYTVLLDRTQALEASAVLIAMARKATG